MPRLSRGKQWVDWALRNEVAALVIYLASDESTFTTGTAQIIDGGWSN
jgi:2-keto-3-deoxy-L-fuconate dehydrogenase